MNELIPLLARSILTLAREDALLLPQPEYSVCRVEYHASVTVQDGELLPLSCSAAVSDRLRIGGFELPRSVSSDKSDVNLQQDGRQTTPTPSLVSCHPRLAE